MRKVVVVGGPTASGKSALALRLAEEFGGVVINADSMQVYAGLPILTAQPSADDRARAPHRLYGVLPPSEVCSAGRWRALAEDEVRAAWQGGSLPIVVGGTGLYLRALLDGLSPIPDIPPTVRAEARAMLEALGNADFHARLAERDPVTAARLHPGNSQRLVRAWEVLEATGRSLADWQAEPPVERLEAEFATLVLEPSREQLAAACDGRFLTMVEKGALAEVAALAALALDADLPVMKALGVPDLLRHLRGEATLDDAVTAAQAATRRYAKRQQTWFRHQIQKAFVVDAQFSESLWGDFFAFVRRFLLTGPG